MTTKMALPKEVPAFKFELPRELLVAAIKQPENATVTLRIADSTRRVDSSTQSTVHMRKLA